MLCWPYKVCLKIFSLCLPSSAVFMPENLLFSHTFLRICLSSQGEATQGVIFKWFPIQVSPSLETFLYFCLQILSLCVLLATCAHRHCGLSPAMTTERIYHFCAHFADETIELQFIPGLKLAGRFSFDILPPISLLNKYHFKFFLLLSTKNVDIFWHFPHKMFPYFLSFLVRVENTILKSILKEE